VPTRRSPQDWGEYASALATNLHRHRIAAGLSQEALAHRAGITRNYYQQLERGRLGNGAAANPSLRVVLHLVAVLDTTLDELLPSSASVDWTV
jgi:transcriptional regulator with XRE-family HTH domain